MKRYCPKCGSYSIFTFWKKLTQFAVCRNCWHKTPADQFRIDYGYWDHVNDWVHEYINEHRGGER